MNTKTMENCTSSAGTMVYFMYVHVFVDAITTILVLRAFSLKKEPYIGRIQINLTKV